MLQPVWPSPGPGCLSAGRKQSLYFATANWVRFASTVCAAAVRTAPPVPSGSWVLAGRLQALKASARNKMIESSLDRLDMFLFLPYFGSPFGKNRTPQFSVNPRVETYTTICRNDVVYGWYVIVSFGPIGAAGDVISLPICIAGAGRMQTNLEAALPFRCPRLHIRFDIDRTAGQEVQQLIPLPEIII
jgi:hypothetical protein